MTTFSAQFGWSQRFVKEISHIVGGQLLTPATFEDDTERATDFMVFNGEQVRVAARMRRHRYLRSYGDEFTIRAYLPSGAKTELRKVIEGWGTHIFYGFADEDERRIAQWFLGDLRVFRGWYSTQLSKLDKGRLPGMPVPNPDNTEGRAFRLEDLPDDFIIARRTADVLVAA